MPNAKSKVALANAAQPAMNMYTPPIYGSGGYRVAALLIEDCEVCPRRPAHRASASAPRIAGAELPLSPGGVLHCEPLRRLRLLASRIDTCRASRGTVTLSACVGRCRFTQPAARMLVATDSHSALRWLEIDAGAVQGRGPPTRRLNNIEAHRAAHDEKV